MKIDPDAKEFAAISDKVREIYEDQFDEQETAKWEKEAQQKLEDLFRANGLADKIPLIRKAEPQTQDAPDDTNLNTATLPVVPVAPTAPTLTAATTTNINNNNNNAATTPVAPRQQALPPVPVDNPDYTGKGVLHQGRYYAHVAFTKAGWLDLKLDVNAKNIIRQAYGVNREDVADFVTNVYKVNTGKDRSWDFDIDDIESFERAATGKIPGYKDAGGLHSGPAFSHWPIVPSSPTSVEKSNVDTFQNFAQPGNAFTGLVKFHERNEETGRPFNPLIYLHPTQATGEYLKSGVLPFPEGPNDSTELSDWQKEGKALPDVLKNATIDNKKPGYYSTHQGQQASSHLKVQDMTDTPTGMGIGFTVIKGGPLSENKFTFVSRSNNVQIFSALSPKEEKLPSEQKIRLKLERGIGEGSNTPPGPWADHITESVDSAVKE